jgi:hypothetical protein
MDSQVGVRACEKGSKRPEIQKVVVRLHAIAIRHSLTLHFRWRRRDTRDLQLCDDGSKLDTCDFALNEAAFQTLQREWKVRHTVDGFATTANTLVRKFFSLHHCQDTAGVDFFAQELRGEDVWAHPPRCKIAETVRRMQICGAVGTILVPNDSTEIWWPLVAPGARGTVTRLMDGREVQMREHYKRGRGLLRCRGRLLPPGFRDLVAVRLDFRHEDLGKSASPGWLAKAQAERR